MLIAKKVEFRGSIVGNTYQLFEDDRPIIVEGRFLIVGYKGDKLVLLRSKKPEHISMNSIKQAVERLY